MGGHVGFNDEAIPRLTGASLVRMLVTALWIFLLLIQRDC